MGYRTAAVTRRRGERGGHYRAQLIGSVAEDELVAFDAELTGHYSTQPAGGRIRVALDRHLGERSTKPALQLRRPRNRQLVRVELSDQVWWHRDVIRRHASK